MRLRYTLFLTAVLFLFGAAAAYAANYGLIWDAAYAPNQDGYGRYATDIDIDSSGNVYAVANNSSFGYSAALVKYNTSGQFQWERIINDGVITFAQLWGASVDAENSAVVGGWYSHDGGNTNRMMAAKYDAAGNLIWQSFYPSLGIPVGYQEPARDCQEYQLQESTGLTCNGRGHSIAVDSSNNVYITGEGRAAYGTGGSYDTYQTMGTVKFSSSGSFQWAKFYPEPGSPPPAVSFGFGVAIATDNAGNAYSINAEGRLLKYSATGAMLNDFGTLNGISSVSLGGSNIQVSPNGDIYVATGGGLYAYSATGALRWSKLSAYSDVIFDSTTNTIYAVTTNQVGDACLGGGGIATDAYDPLGNYIRRTGYDGGGLASPLVPPDLAVDSVGLLHASAASYEVNGIGESRVIKHYGVFGIANAPPVAVNTSGTKNAKQNIATSLSFTNSSCDPDGWNSQYGLAAGGRCQWNTAFSKNVPTPFATTIQSPSGAAACNITTTHTFTDPFGINTYNFLRLIDNMGAESNIATQDINVLSPYDLTAQAISIAPISPRTGDTVSVSAQIANVGEANAQASSARLRIDIDNNGSWDTMPSDQPAPAITVGSSATVTWQNAFVLAPTGTHKLEVCADSGGAIPEFNESNNCATTIITVLYAAFDYTLTNGGDISASQGAPSTNTITATRITGMPTNIAFTVPVLPSGTTASFNPAGGCSPSPVACTAILTLTPSQTTLPGNYTITVNGAFPAHSTQFTLTVVTFDYSITNNYANTPLVLNQTSSGPITVSLQYISGIAQQVNIAVPDLPIGTTISPNPPSSCRPSPACQSAFTVTAGAGTPGGNYTITITGNAPTRTTSFVLRVIPFEYALSSAGDVVTTAGYPGSTYITATLTGGSAQPVIFSLPGLPPGATGVLNPISCTPSPTCSVMLTVTPSGSASPGSYPFIVRGSPNSISVPTNLSVFGITSVVPSEGLTDGGTSVIISGAGFNQVRRRAVTISNPPTNLTDFQVLVDASSFPILTGGVKFYDGDGTTTLNYWEESPRKYWVRIPSIAVAGPNVIYLQYAGIGANAASNGVTTFDFFDDFSGSSLDIAKWKAYPAAGITVSGGKLTILKESVYTNAAIYAQPGLKVEARISWNNLVGLQSGLNISSSKFTDFNNNPPKKLMFLNLAGSLSPTMKAWADNGVNAGYDNNAGYDIGGTFGESQGNISAGMFYIFGVAKNDTQYVFFRDRSTSGAYSGTWSSTPFYIFLGHPWGDHAASKNIVDINIDWVLARKHANIEPSATIDSADSIVSPRSQFGGTDAAGNMFVSATQMNAITPAHDEGTVDVRVTNGDGNIAVLPNSFTYIADFDYTLANDGNIAVEQNSFAYTGITVSKNIGSSQEVALSISPSTPLPEGASASFSNNPYFPNPTYVSTLTISTGPSTPIGSYPITITGSPLGRMTDLTVEVSSDITPPSKPEIGFQPGAGGEVSCNTINLYWASEDPESGIAKYELFRIVGGVGAFSLYKTFLPGSGEFANRGFVDSLLDENTDYEYFIRAFNGEGLSADSESLSVRTTACNSGGGSSNFEISTIPALLTATVVGGNPALATSSAVFVTVTPESGLSAGTQVTLALDTSVPLITFPSGSNSSAIQRFAPRFVQSGSITPKGTLTFLDPTRPQAVVFRLGVPHDTALGIYESIVIRAEGTDKTASATLRVEDPSGSTRER